MELSAHDRTTAGVNLGGEEATKVESEDEEKSDEVKKLVGPRKPRKEEVDAHDLSHLPYRNWCQICVRARGKELHHRKS